MTNICFVLLNMQHHPIMLYTCTLMKMHIAPSNKQYFEMGPLEGTLVPNIASERSPD